MIFDHFFLVLPSFIRRDWVELFLSIFFTEFYWVFVVFFWVAKGITGFYWAIALFCRVLLGCARFYWNLLGFTGFNWFLLDLSSFIGLY